MVDDAPVRAKLLFSTGFLSGLLFASLFLTMLICSRMDHNYQKIRTLENTIDSQRLQLENLTQTLDKRRKYVVKIIEIQIDNIDDALEKIAMEGLIRQKYAHLIGQEVTKIDPQLVFDVMDRRIFKFNDKEYGLHVQRLVIAERLKLWVEVVTAT